MHVRRVGNSYMKIFFAGGNLFFLFWNTNALFHLFAKFKRCPDRLHHHGLRSWKTFRLEQAHGFVPRCSAHPLGTGCDRFCSALCRSSRCDALPEVHDYCQSLGIPVLIHTLPNRNEALCLGLTHMLKRHPDLSGCLFALGDQPLLRPGHWNGYAGAISNAKYHHVTLNLFSQILIFPFWNQNCLRIQELQKNHRSYSSAASK